MAIGRRRTPRLAVLLVVMAAAALLVGCGQDQRPGTFTFTSPGGQSRVFYDPPAVRGVVPPIAAIRRWLSGATRFAEGGWRCCRAGMAGDPTPRCGGGPYAPPCGGGP